MQILLRGGGESQCLGKTAAEAATWTSPPRETTGGGGRRAADLTRRERQGKLPKIIPPATISHNGPRRFREAAAAAKTGPACGRPGPRPPEPKISPVSCVWCSRPRHYRRRWGSGSSRVARTMTGWEEEEGEGGLCLAQDQGAAQAFVDSLGGGTRHARRRFPRLATVPPSNQPVARKKTIGKRG